MTRPSSGWKSPTSQRAAERIGAAIPSVERDRLNKLADSVLDRGTADGYRALARRHSSELASVDIVKAELLGDDVAGAGVTGKLVRPDHAKSVAPSDVAIAFARADSQDLRVLAAELGVSTVRLREAAVARLAERIGINPTASPGDLLRKTATAHKRPAVDQRILQAVRDAAPLLARDRMVDR